MFDRILNVALISITNTFNTETCSEKPENRNCKKVLRIPSKICDEVFSKKAKSR